VANNAWRESEQQQQQKNTIPDKKEQPANLSALNFQMRHHSFYDE